MDGKLEDGGGESRKCAFTKLMERLGQGAGAEGVFSWEELAQLCAEGRENGQFDSPMLLWKGVSHF